jgi:hypothetical protein
MESNFLVPDIQTEDANISICNPRVIQLPRLCGNI